MCDYGKCIVREPLGNDGSLGPPCMKPRLSPWRMCQHHEDEEEELRRINIARGRAYERRLNEEQKHMTRDERERAARRRMIIARAEMFVANECANVNPNVVRIINGLIDSQTDDNTRAYWITEATTYIRINSTRSSHKVLVILRNLISY